MTDERWLAEQLEARLAGLIWRADDSPKVVWDFEVQDGVVVAIDMIADTQILDELELVDLR